MKPDESIRVHIRESEGYFVASCFGACDCYSRMHIGRDGFKCEGGSLPFS